MNKRQQKELVAYHGLMAGLQKRIADTEKLLRGIQWRLKQHPGAMLSVSVYTRAATGYRDHGTYVNLPADIVGPAFVPTLRAKLAEMRKELRELPAVKVTTDGS